MISKAIFTIAFLNKLIRATIDYIFVTQLYVIYMGNC